jgi:hypothetical protein
MSADARLDSYSSCFHEEEERLKDHSSKRIGSPAWFARHKDNGRAPKADGAIAR